MGSCSTTDIKANVDKAIKMNVDRVAAGKAKLLYAAVDVTIKGEAAGKLEFTTTGEDSKVHTYSFPLTDEYCWLACPSTAVKAGDTGSLLISNVGLGLGATDNGVRIYGCTPDAQGQTLLRVKWPDDGADDTITSVDIWPTSVVVSGYANGDPSQYSGSVELLDGSLAALRQTITFDLGAKITLALTPDGMAQFQLPSQADAESALKLLGRPYDNDARERGRAWAVLHSWLSSASASAHQVQNSAALEKILAGIKAL